MSYRYLRILLLTISLSISALSQSPEIITTNLQLPTKIITAGQSSLLVGESGFANNNSRISRVDRTAENMGEKIVLVDGLPGALNTLENSRSGVTGLKLVGLKLYVTIGQTDSVVRGGRGGIVPNPAPASPLNNSVLELTLPADYEVLSQGFTLQPSHHSVLAARTPVSLENSQGKKLGIKLLANLPDYKTENVPGLPQGNVRPANLFGIEKAEGHLFVVDASFNMLYKIDPATGKYDVYTTFPPIQNPLPFGPPFSEAVPNSVRLYKGDLLVSNLVGFPFASGTSQILRIDLEDGSHWDFIQEITSAMDVLPVPASAFSESFFILEFSSNMLGNPMPNGRLTLMREGSLDGNGIDQVYAQLISPTSMARDGESGDIFITEIFPGRITRVPGTFDPRTQRQTQETSK